MLRTGSIGVLVCCSCVWAHDGRRLEVRVEDGRLVTQGYLSDGVDDGAGLIRPYYNSLHDHFSNRSAGLGAQATLPGFDVLDPGPLAGHDLILSFADASRWVAPPTMPAPGTVPNLEPLLPEETISMFRGGDFITTDTPGRLLSVVPIGAGGTPEIDLFYTTAIQPENVLYVLRFEISTTAPDVVDSGFVHIILSPDGTGPIERLHHASLYLERTLGTPIPAPTGITLVALAGAGIACRRRR